METPREISVLLEHGNKIKIILIIINTKETTISFSTVKTIIIIEKDCCFLFLFLTSAIKIYYINLHLLTILIDQIEFDVLHSSLFELYTVF